MVVYLISFSEATITDLNHSIATQLYILHISVYKNINLYMICIHMFMMYMSLICTDIIRYTGIRYSIINKMRLHVIFMRF